MQNNIRRMNIVEYVSGYKYLRALCKMRSIKVEDLAKKCNLSRTTLYRYMKGILQTPPEIEQRFAGALDLNAQERQELRRLLSLNIIDNTLISARYVLDSFIFGDDNKKTVHPLHTFAYYDNETYLRGADELYSHITEQMTQTGLGCRIKIIDCMEDAIIDSIGRFVTAVSSFNPLFSAEHLVSFPKKNHHKCISAFLNLIMLIRITGYNVLYSESESIEHSSSIFDNIMLVELFSEENEEKNQYYVFSFLNGGLSQCVRLRDRYAYLFFSGSFDICKQQYSSSLYEGKHIGAMSEFLMDIERSHEFCIIKPNLCYNMIPAGVYKGLADRMTDEQLEVMLSEIHPLPIDRRNYINALVNTMKQRTEYTSQNKHIDLHSRGSLEQLAATGKLSDHVEGLPPFNKEELRQIFEHVLKRHAQSNGRYSLFISDREFLKNGCIITAYKGYGLFIEYSDKKVQLGGYDNIVVKNAMLSDIIFDYVINHVTAYHTMQPDDAAAFIRMLIDKYLS